MNALNPAYQPNFPGGLRGNSTNFGVNVQGGANLNLQLDVNNSNAQRGQLLKK